MGYKTERNQAYDFRDVLSRNIEALMDYNPIIKSQSEVSRHCKIPQRTVGRILNGEVHANLSSLVGIATAFGIEPWQLLVPGLNPANLPRLHYLDEQQADALAKLVAAIGDVNAVASVK